jgi:hypothetical protein
MTPAPEMLAGVPPIPTQDHMQTRRIACALAVLSGSAAAQSGQPANVRLIPDISAVGDFVGDFSKRSTQEDGKRFSLREVEVALQAAVDPYFRGDVFLGFSDEEGVAIEQMFLTTSALPFGLQARVGRFIMPVGKQITTHRHDLHTIEYPHVIQLFTSAEGLKGTGVSLSKVLSPLGFYQELIVTTVEELGENEDLTPDAPANAKLSGLGYSARLRNYWDVSENANIEISANAATGLRPQPLAEPLASGADAVNVRQTLIGGDVTFRWKPLQQGLYKSFILQAELMQQRNERPVVPELAVFAGPERDFTGGYVFARWQLTRRTYLGGRFDHVDDPSAPGTALRAGSAMLQFYPSEFSKLIAQFERVSPEGAPSFNRFLVQATFAIGPHKPHPF